LGLLKLSASANAPRTQDRATHAEAAAKIGGDLFFWNREIEKIDEAGVDIVLGTDDHEFLMPNHILEKFTAMAEVIGRRQNIGTDGIAKDIFFI
jgi:hypothetical protein